MEMEVLTVPRCFMLDWEVQSKVALIFFLIYRNFIIFSQIGWNNENYPVTACDINGDGLEDLVGFGSSSFFFFCFILFYYSY